MKVEPAAIKVAEAAVFDRAAGAFFDLLCEGEGEGAERAGWLGAEVGLDGVSSRRWLQKLIYSS